MLDFLQQIKQHFSLVCQVLFNCHIDVVVASGTVPPCVLQILHALLNDLSIPLLVLCLVKESFFNDLCLFGEWNSVDFILRIKWGLSDQNWICVIVGQFEICREGLNWDLRCLLIGQISCVAHLDWTGISAPSRRYWLMIEMTDATWWNSRLVHHCCDFEVLLKLGETWSDFD